MIEDDDLVIFDTSIFGSGKEFSIQIKRLTISELEVIRNRMIANEKLRERIVDLADLWDGKKSQRYGETLIDILEELEIFDIPQFYSKENIKQLLDEYDKERS